MKNEFLSQLLSTVIIWPLETWSSEILKFYSQIQKQHQFSLIRHSSHSNALERLRNSLVRSSLPSNLELGTFNCSRKRCNTCPFINSKTHIQGPKGSYQVNNQFDCTTSNIIYCITCTLCNKLYIGEFGRKLGDRFRENLRDVKNKESDLSKPVARYFSLPGHSHEHMEICGINLHFGTVKLEKGKNRDSF